MAYLNIKERVLEAKVVYYGAGLSGKTTNLEQIKKLSEPDRCGEMMSLDTAGDRTLFFDWLPFNMGKFNGCDIRVQLYTVPGQAKYAETRKRVLVSADGIVLVLDSQSGAIDRNRQTIDDLREHMQANGMSMAKVPVVVQLNKRDLPTAMDGAELLATLGIPDWPCVSAVASRGEGVFETLQETTRLVLQSVRNSARASASDLKTGAASGLDGHSMYGKLVDDGVAPAKPELTPSSGPMKPAVANSAPLAAAPAVRPPSPSNGSNGHHAGNGHHASNGHLAANGLSVVATIAAPPLAPPAAPPSKNAVLVEDRSTSAQPTSAADTALMARSLALMAELLAGQQALLRRVDVLEDSIDRHTKAIAPELLQSRDAQEKRNEEKLSEWMSSVDSQLYEIGTSLSQAPTSLEKLIGSAIDDKISMRFSSVDDYLAEIKSAVRANEQSVEKLISQKSDGIISDLRAAATALDQAAQGRVERTLRGIEDARGKTKAELQQSVSYMERRVEVHVAHLVEAQAEIRGEMDQAVEALRSAIEGVGATVDAIGTDLVTMTSSVAQNCEEQLRPPFNKVFSSLKGVGESTEKQLAAISSLEARLTELKKSVTTLSEEFKQGQKSWWRG